MACANLKSDVSRTSTTATRIRGFSRPSGASAPSSRHKYPIRGSSMTSVIKDRILGMVPRKGRAARVIAAAAFTGLFVVACDVHGTSEPGSLSSMTISPNPKTMAINGTQQFVALGTDFSGAAVTITPVWSVVAGGGSISATGMFTAGTAPQTYTNTVMATSGGLTSTATVVVTSGALATITVTPTPATLAVGGTQQFTATGKDASGNAVVLTPVWSITNGGGTIGAATGLFTAGTTSGTYANTVRATSGTISGSATVTVTPVVASITVTPNPASVLTNSTQQFAATARDANGNVIAISPVWAVANGGGSIDANTGLFTAGGVTGTFNNTVTATSGTITGRATVTVTSTAP